MNKPIFAIIALVTTTAVTLVESTVVVVQPKPLKDSIVLSEPFEIVSQQGKSLYSNLGNIAARNCGSAGRVLQYRSEGCTSYSLGGVCLFPAGRQFRAELSFVPSVNTESLGVRTILNVPEGEQTVWQNPYVSKDEQVQAGREYTFKAAGGVEPEFRGKMITSQVQIYRESDEVIEACAEADFIIV